MRYLPWRNIRPGHNPAVFARTACGSESTETPCRRNAAPWILAGIVGLGLALRLYRLPDQSYWLDEFLTMTGISSPTWGGCLSAYGFFAPDTMPLSFLFHYGCARLAGTASPFGIRMEQVAAGIVCIPLVYLLGKEMYGRRGGLFAALLVALSPVHIWTSQDIRFNVLIGLCAIVSMLSLVKAMRSDRAGWWILNTLANFCLVWIELILVIPVAAECCFMAFHLRSRFKRVAIWGAAQCAIALSPLIWLGVSLSGVSDVGEDFYRSLPGLRDLVFDLVGDDAARTTDPFVFQGQTWPFMPPHMQQAFDAWHGLFDAAMALFFGVCAVWALLRLFQRRQSPFSFADCAGRPEFFLLIMSFLPPLLLFLGSWVYRPMLMPRYTCYSSFALYAIAGGAVFSVRHAAARKALLAVVLVLYGYQLSLALPADTRTDWRSAIALIRGQASPQDIVLAKGNVYTRDIYRYNARWIPSQRTAPDPAVVPAHTLQSLVEKTVHALSGPSPPLPYGPCWSLSFIPCRRSRTLRSASPCTDSLSHAPIFRE